MKVNKRCHVRKAEVKERIRRENRYWISSKVFRKFKKAESIGTHLAEILKRLLMKCQGYNPCLLKGKCMVESEIQVFHV